METLDIFSFNVRGLRQSKKRHATFRFLKSRHKGVVFLQETHSVLADESEWKKDWGGEIFFSHGSSNSRGVAILFPKSYNVCRNNVQTDNNGRIIILDAIVNYVPIILANVYAPTKDKPKEQIDFLSTLKIFLSDCGNNIILGGDFNVCLQPEIDKCGGRKEPQSA